MSCDLCEDGKIRYLSWFDFPCPRCNPKTKRLSTGVQCKYCGEYRQLSRYEIMGIEIFSCDGCRIRPHVRDKIMRGGS